MAKCRLQRTAQKRTCRSTAERSYPSPKVRGGDREYQAATAQEWPGGATPRPRSGAVAQTSYRMPEVKGGGRQELPHAGGQRRSREELPHTRGQGGGGEEQPQVQGAVAARAQEGQEELLHVQGQEGAAVWRYPSSKVRSSGCTLLKQP